MPLTAVDSMQTRSCTSVMFRLTATRHVVPPAHHDSQVSTCNQRPQISATPVCDDHRASLTKLSRSCRSKRQRSLLLCNAAPALPFQRSATSPPMQRGAGPPQTLAIWSSSRRGDLQSRWMMDRWARRTWQSTCRYAAVGIVGNNVAELLIAACGRRSVGTRAG